MPIAPKWQKVLDRLIKQYGKKKGTRIFYALMRKKGIDYTKNEADMLTIENKKMNFEVPFTLITESAKDSPGGMEIEGVAVVACVSKNGIEYLAEELKNMPSMKGIPILDSHNQESIHNVLGQVTDDWYEESTQSRRFKGLIKDKKAQEKIREGLITKVSIGAMAKKLMKKVKQSVTTYVAKGLEVLELSLVAVPGVVGATFMHSMTEAFKNKERIDMSEELKADIKDEAELAEAQEAVKTLETKNKELSEKLKSFEEEEKDEKETSEEQLQKATEENKKLTEKLEAIEAEKHKEMAEKCTDKIVELGFIKEADKAEELKKNEALDRTALVALYEKVKGMNKEEEDPEDDPEDEKKDKPDKPNDSDKPKEKAKPKGKLGTIKDVGEAGESDLIVERDRDGISFWQMPEESVRIARSEDYGIR